MSCNMALLSFPVLRPREPSPIAPGEFYQSALLMSVPATLCALVTETREARILIQEQGSCGDATQCCAGISVD